MSTLEALYGHDDSELPDPTWSTTPRRHGDQRIESDDGDSSNSPYAVNWTDVSSRKVEKAECRALIYSLDFKAK